ncbi:hypothetical protein SPRG_09976 [Saprolegnia parasitica CBS 223.65]|uniref:BED-type domain-containing protein n=1 Tax=Saprolegnia parasitica (strain CBS 223.65) TaxID=695850 RepID=A0A067BY45_SAPPC|nr:hypothetical protein SPRG_09976 [Saprolegnia parasitica CBS 223.65]KDO23168.1 hypothetical protein SPRG_09976 [Saprolegnia parasitica CBS 223.65]|eukprot:XP_012206120.1 hypothetical protein SPRG_09976 [Saprolegnia parasitica CBS 223.65]
MPRPASNVWIHFRRDEVGKRAICKYCHHNMVSLVTRMRHHLAKRCTDVPPSIRADIITGEEALGAAKQASAMGLHAADALSLHNAAQFANMTTQYKPAMMKRDAPPADPKNKKPRKALPPASNPALERHDMQSYLAKAIFGAGLPVSVIDHPCFTGLMKRMYPLYQSPGNAVLTTTLLDNEFHAMSSQVRADVAETVFLCLGVESWSFASNRSVISYSVHSPTPAVYAIENTREAPHVPMMLFEHMEATINAIGIEKVATIVADISVNMKQACDVLQAKFTHLTILPSCAHAMEALVAEVLSLPTFQPLLRVCSTVATFITSNHVPRASFTRVASDMHLDSFGLVTAGSDPASLLACVYSIEKHRHIFEMLLGEDLGALDGLDESVKEKLLTLSWWAQLAQFKALLSPFVDVLAVFDDDYPSLSTFYHAFTLLWTHLQTHPSVPLDVTRVVNKHWHAMRHPAMYTAYLLDPRFPPSSLGNDETNEAFAFLKQLSSPAMFSSLISELTRYTGRVGVFADDAVWASAKECSPLHWWKGFIGSSCPNLQVIAIRVLCFPATSGITHEKRAVLDRIHLQNRHLMNEEQACKAAFVYLNSNVGARPVGDTIFL